MNAAPIPLLSVIVPALDGARMLAESLPALCASDLPRSDWELIVVDDASTDGTAEVAARFADRVIRLDGPANGPAFARNRGCEAARGDILVFVDADVCVHPDVLRKFLDTLSDAPGMSAASGVSAAPQVGGAPQVGAVFGAYDTAPRAPGLVSQYRNLLHHYVHASQAGDADTFWAGCGAVRRSAFLEAGGFDAQRYGRPQIEDIELGYRLRENGCRIMLRPDIQATHLKRWTLCGMVLNDVRDRGIPWMRLLLEREAMGAGTLNVRAEERLLTGTAALGLVAFVAAPVLGSWLLAAFGGACILLILVRNLALFRWFAQVRGPRLALGVVPLRLLYYLLNAAVASLVLMQHLPSRIAGRRVGTPAAGRRTRTTTVGNHVGGHAGGRAGSHVGSHSASSSDGAHDRTPVEAATNQPPARERAK